MVDEKEFDKQDKIILIRKYLEIIPLQIKLEELKRKALQKKIEKKYIPKSMIKILLFSILIIPGMLYLSGSNILSNYLILSVNLSKVLCCLTGSLYSIALVMSLIDDIKSFIDYKSLISLEQEISEKIKKLEKSLEENKVYLTSLLEKKNANKMPSASLEDEKEKLELLKNQIKISDITQKDIGKTYIKR